MSNDEPALRLRCPEDVAHPDPTGGHVRVDIGMPVSLDLLPRLVRAVDPCVCGRKLVILAADQSDPWRDHG